MKNKLKSKSIVFTLGILLWLFLTIIYVYQYNFSFTVTSYTHSKNSIVSVNHDKLLKGDLIRGSFSAKENNLGIVRVNLVSNIEVDYEFEDTLHFRIKEEFEKDWFHTSTFTSGGVKEYSFYPFGFPIISDSKNKRYIFEIESTKGNDKNAVSLSRWEPAFISMYKFERTSLQQDNAWVGFQVNKVITSFQNPHIIFYSLVYLIPLLLLIFYSTNLIKTKNFLVSGFILVIMFDIFLISVINEIAIVLLSIIWLIVLIKQKMQYQDSFKIGLLLIILAFVLNLLSLFAYAEKTVIWSYAFFVTGAIHLLLVLNNKVK